MTNPTCFISYSWDNDAHMAWVRDFAARLRGDNIDVKLDQWETAPGDQLPVFMERSIRENDYVLIICTQKYKRRSDNREGGVGYEGDIMTAEVFATQNHRKFIPVLRVGDWLQAAPAWLTGSYYVDLRGDPYPERGYNDLLTTFCGTRAAAPRLGSTSYESSISTKSESVTRVSAANASADIRIEGIVVDQVTEPRMDGTRGSALYRIPLRLSQVPSSEWCRLFVENWNHPPSFTTMHRPGIASVQGDRIILDGTTIEEVEQYHRDTLVLAVKETNRMVAELKTKRAEEDARRQRQSEEHHKDVEDRAKRIKFD
jgi:hypothetical protein